MRFRSPVVNLLQSECAFVGVRSFQGGLFEVSVQNYKIILINGIFRSGYPYILWKNPRRNLSRDENHYFCSVFQSQYDY